MPLSETGKRVLKKMRKTYGKKKGESVFYATENKKGGKQWHKKGRALNY
jgi:hypothetical protein